MASQKILTDLSVTGTAIAQSFNSNNFLSSTLGTGTTNSQVMSAGSAIVYVGNPSLPTLQLQTSNTASGVSVNGSIILHTTNFNTYAPKLDGTGATGTWGISITGNAASATKLATARTIWGQSFDGTANISADITGAGNITGNGNLTLGGGTTSGLVIGAAAAASAKTIQSYGSTPLALNSVGNNVLIGTATNSTYLLDVAGTGRYSDLLKIKKDVAGIQTVLQLENIVSTNATHGTSIFFKGFYNQSLLTSSKNPTQATGGDLQIQTYYNETVLNIGIFLSAAGKVGINTITPSEYLEVTGNGKFTGTITATDGTQGLVMRAYLNGGGYGSIYASTVTPTIYNYALAISNTDTVVNGITTLRLGINGTTTMTMNASGSTFTAGITAPSFTGALAGNATTATSATGWKATNGTWTMDDANLATSGVYAVWARDANNAVMRQYNAAAVLTFLGSPSTGETLQSVITRGGSISSGFANTGTRPTLSATVSASEIRAISSSGSGGDDGFLRLSGGGGTGTQRSYIDISGYSTVADMSNNIVFGVTGAERMRLTVTGATFTGTVTATAFTGNATSATTWNRISVSDFNAPTGFQLLQASGSTTTNQPTGTGWGQGIQFSTNNDANYANQLVYDVNGNLFTRSKVNTIWGSWSTIITSTNYNSFALPIAGGDMTGSIGIPAANKFFPRTSAVADWYFAYGGSTTDSWDFSATRYRFGKLVSGTFTPNVTLEGTTAITSVISGSLYIGGTSTNQTEALKVNGLTTSTTLKATLDLQIPVARPTTPIAGSLWIA